MPTLSGRKEPARADRDTPDGKTLAAALALLDPRVVDPAQLDVRRADFERQLRALVPDRDARRKLGFDRLLRWHQLYTRQLVEHRRNVDAQRARLKELFGPPKEHWIEIDPSGVARLCMRPPEPAPVLEVTAPKKPTKVSAPVVVAAPPPFCRPVAGLPQLQHEVDVLDDGVRSLVEAEWYLVTHVDRLRARFDPEGARSMPLEPEGPAATP